MLYNFCYLRQRKQVVFLNPSFHDLDPGIFKGFFIPIDAEE